MIIGIPREIKNNENRVGTTLSGVAGVVKQGHQVCIQRTAGINGGFPDETCLFVGAQVLPTIEDVYATADMIVKVKEPIAPEYHLIRKGQLLFTCFRFASDKEPTLAIIDNKSTCLTYETVEEEDHSLPLLIPMNEVAGRMSVQKGTHFLEKPQGGKGILLGGVPGVKPAKVLILGGGIVGGNAAQVAAGMGADITVTDVNLSRLHYLSETLPKNVKTLYASELRTRKELSDVDLVIGSVLIPGNRVPHLITRSTPTMMQLGTVLVDVVMDQGGCFETSHPATRNTPTCVVDGIVHYAVANIPGAVPYTSALALISTTPPYVIALANKGWKKACKDDPALALDLNVAEGKVVYKTVAGVFDLRYEDINL